MAASRIDRHAEDVERDRHLGAHRVDVAERIGRGDLAVGVGVVHDRCEEVDGEHHRAVVADPIHRRIVRHIEADQEVLVGGDAVRQSADHGVEVARTDLGRASGEVGQLRQARGSRGHTVLRLLESLRE